MSDEVDVSQADREAWEDIRDWPDGSTPRAHTLNVLARHRIASTTPKDEAIDELVEALESIRSAAKAYITNYLADELADPEFTGIDEMQHGMLSDLNWAVRNAERVLIAKHRKVKP